MHCALISRQKESRDLIFLYKKKTDARGELRQTLITRIVGMIQREIHANNVEHKTLDGLCFRGEQLARQVARLVTANVLDSSVLNCIMFAYEKLTFCLQQVESEEWVTKQLYNTLVVVEDLLTRNRTTGIFS